MNNKTGFNRLNRKHSHRKALLKNLLCAVLERGSVVTTLAKAKEVRILVDRSVEKAKKYTLFTNAAALHQLRLLSRNIHRKDLLMKLCNNIAPGYSQRVGGYTRVVRLGQRRGDGSQMAVLQFVQSATNIASDTG